MVLHIEAETKWTTFRGRHIQTYYPFFNGNVWISTKISLKFVPKGPINNIPALLQIMSWRRQGDKPLSETMMVSLLMHICVTRPHWVNAINAIINHASEWVIKFNGLLGDSGHRGPWSRPDKPCNHSLYTGIIIFPHINNTQCACHDYFKTTDIKK